MASSGLHGHPYTHVLTEACARMYTILAKSKERAISGDEKFAFYSMIEAEF